MYLFRLEEILAIFHNIQKAKRSAPLVELSPFITTRLDSAVAVSSPLCFFFAIVAAINVLLIECLGREKKLSFFNENVVSSMYLRYSIFPKLDFSLPMFHISKNNIQCPGMQVSSLFTKILESSN